ncbi:MAG: zf-HC2 domain-containing protein [Nitrospirae bacterium]|nr:zf-HC2 domain-containing protein [Nitrospirota bacterium]
MDCREIQEQITAFVDRELPPEESARLSEHLHACSSCRAAEERERDVKRLVRSRCADLTLPHGFAERIRASLPGDDAARPVPAARPEPRTGRSSRIAGGGAPRAYSGWLAAAAIGFLAIAGTLVWSRSGVEPVLAEALVDEHARFAKGLDLGIRESDPKSAAAWLSEAAGSSVPVPDLRPKGARMVGAQMCRLLTQGHGAVVYDVEGHPVTLFIPPSGMIEPSADGTSSEGWRSVRVKGRNAVAWKDARGGICWAVSDLPHARMREIVTVAAADR